MRGRILKFSLCICMAFCMLNVNFAQDSKSAQDLKNAIKLSISERYEEANDAYQKIIKAEPNNGDAYFYYGENILNSYVADPFSSTLTEACTSARSIFQNGLKADSTNKLNDIGLGMVVLLEKNDTTRANYYFNKAESTFPKNKKRYTEKHILMLVKLGTGQLFAKVPRYKKAVAYVELAKEVAPNNPDVYDALGDIHMSKNDASSAIANYNRALYLNPTSPVYQVKIGSIYTWARNLKEALIYFEKAKSIDSTFAPLYTGLGALYYMNGNYKLSQYNYKKFLDLSGNNTAAKVKYANALFKSKDFDGALKEIAEILAVDKSRPYLYRLGGYSAFDKKPADYIKALSYLDDLFKNMPSDKLILSDYVYYGKTLVAAKQQDTVLVDKGFGMLLKAYQMDTTNVKLFAEMVDLSQRLHRNKITADLLNFKIQSGRATASDYISLGKLYYQTKQYEKADSVFTKLTKVEPNNVQAYLWIANTAFNLDPESKLGTAKPKYEKVIEKALSDSVKYAPELFNAYSFLGSYYLFGPKQDLTNAIKYYQKILKLDPKNPQITQWKIKAYFSLGISYSNKNLKKYTEAKEYYQKVLELDPGNKDAKKAIEDINKVLKSIQEQQQ
jgi:tetratricopeptide (TPR) repeat protein